MLCCGFSFCLHSKAEFASVVKVRRMLIQLTRGNEGRWSVTGSNLRLVAALGASVQALVIAGYDFDALQFHTLNRIQLDRLHHSPPHDLKQ